MNRSASQKRIVDLIDENVWWVMLIGFPAAGVILGYLARWSPSELIILVAVLLGALFAHEAVTLRTLLAAMLIIGSVALIITVQQLRSRPMPPITAAIETECVR